MSQGGSPSQEVARGVIRIEPDMSAVDAAMREYEQKFETWAESLKAKASAIFGNLPDIAGKVLEASQQASAPANAPQGKPTERERPDDVLVKLTEIHASMQRIESETTEIAETVRTIAEREGP
jgi:hypothetical protein